MRRSSKHQYEKMAFSPLSGGINVSVPAEQIAENEMAECENFIFDKDTARLVGRGGLTEISTFQSNVKELYYDIDTNMTFAFLDNRDCYALVLGDVESQRTFLEAVTGSGKPKCCKFKNMLFVASGGHLQFYDFSADKNWLQSIKQYISLALQGLQCFSSSW